MEKAIFIKGNTITPTLEGYNITEHEYNKTIFLEVS